MSVKGRRCQRLFLSAPEGWTIPAHRVDRAARRFSRASARVTVGYRPSGRNRRRPVTGIGTAYRSKLSINPAAKIRIPKGEDWGAWACTSQAPRLRLQARTGVLTVVRLSACLDLHHQAHRPRHLAVHQPLSIQRICADVLDDAGSLLVEMLSTGQHVSTAIIEIVCVRIVLAVTRGDAYSNSRPERPS